MMKRIISLVLCLGMIAGALLMAGCDSETKTNTTDEALPMTLNFVGITENTTTQQAIDATEEALNRIFKTEFKTQIELTLVTADKYIALIEEKVQEAEQAKIRISAISKYNTMAQKLANQEQRNQTDDSKGGLFGKWTQNAEVVEASTISTGEVYTAEQTTVHPDGKIETVYPGATSPIDILMIDSKETYDYLDEKGYLLSISGKLTTEFTKFRQYIYPTFFDQLETITGDIKAIPNNNLLAEYTYLVVDKELADKYDLDVDAIDSYDDLDVDGAGFLSEVAANESVTPLATEPDALGIYTYFEGDIPVGTYYNPIYGYNPAEGTDFTIRNLFDIPEYTNHLKLMEEYRDNGYMTKKGDQFAVDVVKGDASLPEAYGDDYYVKVIQNPFVEMDVLFDGMLAVSSYAADETRALQIIQAINTDPEVKNLLQYGIAYNGDNDDVANYEVIETENEDGTVSISIKRLNQNYMMNNALTGNVYMGYPEEGQSVNIWDYYKQTNLDSALSPFLYFYVGDSDLDSMLNSIIRRAALTEVFDPIGIDYDEYERLSGTTQGNAMRHDFKVAYAEFFVNCLTKETGLVTEPLNFVTKGAGSAVDQDFIEFVLSKEGQAILSSIGFTKVDKNADPYEKKASMSGTVSLMPNTGTSYLGYITPLMTELADAYTAMYPEVEVKVMSRDQDKGYNGNLATLDGTTYTIGISLRDLVSTEEGKNLEVTKVATSYLKVFADDTHDTYRYSWYEEKMIEKIKAEKYADIVSASGLTSMAKNKLAALCGIDLTRYALANRPASESIVLNNAKTAAANYYNNLEYLRVMADELLFTDEESANYAGLKGVDYETAVFEYVRKNYEIKNNLTDEDYEKLVQDFMVSVLEYTSPDDKTTKYTVSWEEFQETKENAQVYIEAATKIKDAYYEKLKETTSEGLLRLYKLPGIIELVYDVMYQEYLTENNLDKAEFENSVKDIYLGEVGSSAEEFATYAKTSDEYQNVCANLRKEYKKLLISIFGKTTYDKGESGISNALLLETLFEHFLEEEIKVNEKMCDLANIDYDTFAEAEGHMENYDMYISTMKTMFVYTLRTVYKTSEIDSWSNEEAEANIYKVLNETGFYTNELAQYIGLTLSDYMLAKSEAVTYQNYLSTLVNALSAELQAKGYNTTEFLKEDGDVIESVCLEIVLDKYYSEKISIQDVVESTSAKYMQGLANAADLETYLAEAKAATNSDYFYMAVINSLQSAWDEAKEG